MFKLAKPFFITCETPLHAGSGNDLGVVDLPIQRERHTDFPKIEGSSLKGSIREAFEEYVLLKKNSETEKEYQLVDKELPQDEKNQQLKKLREIFSENGKGIDDKWREEKRGKDDREEKTTFIKFQESISLAFGPESTGDSGHAGALGFTDARILLFPVKSMRGVFAYITCPKVLERFEKELKLAFGENYQLNWSVPSTTNHYSSDSVLISGKVILEEYTFDVTPNDNIKNFAQFLSQKTDIAEIENKVILLSNDDFKDFINLSTEVITRTKIDNVTGTVVGGALFTEEYLPAETILYSLALTTPIFNENKGIFAKKNGEEEYQKVMKFFEKGIPEVIQIGANATIGKGIVTIKTFDKEGDDNANAPSDQNN